MTRNPYAKGPTRLGPTRLQPRLIRTGLFSRSMVLIHQSLVEKEHWSWLAGQAEVETVRVWIDTPPEWLLENGDPDDV